MDLFEVWKHQSCYGDFISFQARIYPRTRSLASHPVDDDHIQNIERILVALLDETKLLEIDAVSDLIDFTLLLVRNQEHRLTYSQLYEKLTSVQFLFQSQCQKLVFMRLTKAESLQFTNQTPFGAVVAEAFSSSATRYEILEATKSLALGRYTACVFHLMRVLEKGLKALATQLNVNFAIPFDYQNWQNIIDQIEAEIRKQEKNPAGQLKTDTLQAYAEIAKQFRYFKDAWRNSVAHSRETYAPEQALSIYLHVKEFMVSIVAIGLKE